MFVEKLDTVFINIDIKLGERKTIKNPLKANLAK